MVFQNDEINDIDEISEIKKQEILDYQIFKIFRENEKSNEEKFVKNQLISNN